MTDCHHWLDSTVLVGTVDGKEEDDGRGGATIFVFKRLLRAAVFQAGGAPASRDCMALQLGSTVQVASGLLFTGGSAFGLDSTAGLVRFQKERGLGVTTSAGVVPVCPAVAIFDLASEKRLAYPSENEIYKACSVAVPVSEFMRRYEPGPVGAGTGARSGRGLLSTFGLGTTSPGGLGWSTRAVRIRGPPGGNTVSWDSRRAFEAPAPPSVPPSHEEQPGPHTPRVTSASETISSYPERTLLVSAFAVVNCWGDVIDARGDIIAGARDVAGSFINSAKWIAAPKCSNNGSQAADNTTLVALFVNMRGDRESLTRLAKMASAGIARATAPAFSPFDGDVLLIFSTEDEGSTIQAKERGSELIVEAIAGAASAEVVAEAIRAAVGITSGASDEQGVTSPCRLID